MSTESPYPPEEQHRELETLLRTAQVAYLGLAESPQGGETVSRPYVVPVNFAYVGSFAGTGHESASQTSEGSPGQGRPAPPEPVGDGSFPRLLFHTGIGRKTRALAENPHVCVAVTGDVSFSAGQTPCEDGFHYRSALIWGRARLLESREDRAVALDAIVAKYDPQAIRRSFSERAFAQTQVYEVTIDAVSYRERPRSA